jgi:hypothetical protein
MYMCVMGIYFACLYDFSLIFWNCSDNVVFFLFPFMFKFIQQSDNDRNCITVYILLCHLFILKASQFNWICM